MDFHLYTACVFILLFYMNLCISIVFVCFKFFLQFKNKLHGIT
jgi:hypothetical protein